MNFLKKWFHRDPTMENLTAVLRAGALIIKVYNSHTKESFLIYGSGQCVNGDPSDYEVYYYYTGRGAPNNMRIGPLQERAPFNIGLIDWRKAAVTVYHSEHNVEQVTEATYDFFFDAHVTDLWDCNYQEYWNIPEIKKIPRGYGIKIGQIKDETVYATYDSFESEREAILYRANGKRVVIPYAIIGMFDLQVKCDYEQPDQMFLYYPLGTTPFKRQLLNHKDARRWIVLEKITDYGSDYAVRVTQAATSISIPTEIYNLTLELDDPNLAGQDINVAALIHQALNNNAITKENTDHIAEFRVYLNNIRIRHAGADLLFPTWSSRQKSLADWRNTHPYIYFKDNASFYDQSRNSDVAFINIKSVETELD